MPLNQPTYSHLPQDDPQSFEEETILGEYEQDVLLQPIIDHRVPITAASAETNQTITEARCRTKLMPSTSTSNIYERLSQDEKDQPEHIADDSELNVGSIVPETDDPTLLTNTIRVWLIGGILGAFGAAVNQIFFFKSNGIGFGGFFVTLISYPLGKLMEAVLPSYDVYLPNPFGFLSHKRKQTWWLSKVNLNPGKFSVKEHMLAGILSGCASSAAYAGDIVAVQDLYYHQDMGHFGALLLILSTQLLGFGLSGLTYSILIRPTRMIWPSSLVVVTLYNTLHSVEENSEDRKKFSRDRMKFFTIVFIAIFIYQFLPSVIAPTLTSVSVLCIINNQSTFMRVLGSAYTGAGLFTLSLDWTVIGSAGSLFTPFFASLNYFSGLVASMWILVPLMWYLDFWNNRSFGDNAVSARLFNSDFQKYNVAAVVKPDFTLDEAKFKELGPIRLTPYFAVSYGISFAVLTSAVVSVILFHWEDIKAGTSHRHAQSRNVHVEIMEKNYENVPRKWYAWIGGSMFFASIYVVTFYPLQCPIWALLLAQGMAVFFIIPMGIIKATTNSQIGLNVITEFVAGLLLPGKPLANITFKVYGYMTMSQCLDLASDLKLGIYAKLPPKDVFIFQVFGTSIGAIINYIFIRSVIAEKRDMLNGTTIDPTGQWTGRKPEIFYSASVIWGLIGPIKFFSGNYKVLFWGFPIGIVLPIIQWFMTRNRPKSIWRKLSVPLFLHGAISPPQTPTNIIAVGLISAFVSQYWARRNRPQWFEKYNYVLSSALDSGSSLNALVIYLLGLTAAHSWWNPTSDAEHCKPAIKS